MRLASWPRVPSRVAFPFTFRTGTGVIAQGRRLGVRMWLSSESGADIALIYDHPSYPALVELNEPAPS